MTLTVPAAMVEAIRTGRMKGAVLVGEEVPSPGDVLRFVSDSDASFTCERRVAEGGVTELDFGALRVELEPA